MNLHSTVKKPIKILLILSVTTVIFTALGFTAAEWTRLKSRNLYYRNRMIELDYLRMILNENQYSQNRLARKFRLAKIGTHSYIIPASEVLLSDFFLVNGYQIGSTDFYGFQLQVNELNQIIEVALFKP